jgi:hypothetical protein
MQSDVCGNLTQFTPKLSRFNHQRKSSLSSLASSPEPGSPFNRNSSYLHIAVTDSSNEVLGDIHIHGSTDPHGNS